MQAGRMPKKSSKQAWQNLEDQKDGLECLTVKTPQVTRWSVSQAVSQSVQLAGQWWNWLNLEVMTVWCLEVQLLLHREERIEEKDLYWSQWKFAKGRKDDGSEMKESKSASNPSWQVQVLEDDCDNNLKGKI